MRFDLNTNYQEKEEAKRFAAMWDGGKKTWYYIGDVLPEELRKWYPEEEEFQERRPVNVIDGAELSEKTEKAYLDVPGFEQYKTVSEVNEMIAENFEHTLAFRRILVKGEVTNYNGHSPGRHYYFSIKEEKREEKGHNGKMKKVILPCFMWEDDAKIGLSFELETGQQIALIGELQFYRANGTSSLVVRQIYNIGEGKANLEFLQLKKRLEEEGLFALEHKKPIPKHPERVGIVTSKDGQAIKDICKVAAKRNPYVQLVLYHVKVQGKNAAETIVEGIRRLDALGLDTIIVGRGGGSDEELMVYNEESIARAVYEAETPIVSAVGHQGHWTLIDFVSDKRAATPSEAAEETIPNIMVDIDRLKRLQESIALNMRHSLERRILFLDAKLRALEGYNPEQLLKNRLERIEVLKELMQRNVRHAYESRYYRFKEILARLNGLSPTAKLVNGFGYISHAGKPVVSVEDVRTGDVVSMRMHDGEIR